MYDIGEDWDEPQSDYLSKDSDKKRSGFTQIPNSLIKDKDLSIQARFLYIDLLSYAWENDFAFPSQKTLSEDIGLSERRIRDLLKELEKRGYISIHRFGFNSPNTYKLLVLPEGKHLDKSFDDIFGKKIAEKNSKAKDSRSNRQNTAEPTRSVLPANKTNINKQENSSKKTKKNSKSSSFPKKTTTKLRRRKI